MDTTYLTPILHVTGAIMFYSVFVIILLYFKVKDKTKASTTLIVWQLLYLLTMFIGLITQVNRVMFNYGLFSEWWNELLRFSYFIIVPIANFFGFLDFVNFFKIDYERKRRISTYGIYTVIIIGLTFALLFVPEYMFLGNFFVVIHSLILFVPILWRNIEYYSRFNDPDSVFREKYTDVDRNELKYVFLSRLIVYLCFVLYAILLIFNVLWDYLTGLKYGPFFYLVWTAHFVSSIFSYFAFINPKPFMNFIERIKEKKANKESKSTQN